MTPSSKRYRSMSPPDSKWEIWRFTRSVRPRRDNKVVYIRTVKWKHGRRAASPQEAARITAANRKMFNEDGIYTLWLPIRKNERKPFKFVLIDLGVGK